MSSVTTKLNLYKANPVSDGNDNFNIDTMLNENWNKIDDFAGETITKDKLINNQATTEAGFALDARMGKTFGDSINTMNNTLSNHTTSLNDMDYQTAGGTATAITLTLQTLRNGYAKTFVASANNNGATTTINGKKLYKPSTTISPNLIVGKAYTVWYNASGDSGNGCFFIKASAEGDAIASNVLAGKKFSNDNDTGLTGTMPTKSGATITPSTVNQIISANQYLTGDQTILGDPDLIASNIISTANIFGIQGNATIGSLGGKRVATGTSAQTYGSTVTVDKISTTGTISSPTATFYANQISGAFDFVPRIVIVYSPEYQELSVYTPAGYDKYYSGATVKTCRYDSTTSNNSNLKGDTQGFGVYSGGFRLPCIVGGSARTLYWIAIE